MQAAHHTRCLIKADVPPTGPLLCSEEQPRPFPLLPGFWVMGSAGRQPGRGRRPTSHPSCVAAPLSAYLEHLTHFNYGPAGTSGRAGDARDSPEAPAPGATGHPDHQPGAPSHPGDPRGTPSFRKGPSGWPPGTVPGLGVRMAQGQCAQGGSASRTQLGAGRECPQSL